MEIQITGLDHQGRGIGRINNKIIFIPNTIPGEIVDIKIINEKAPNAIGMYEAKVSLNSNKMQLIIALAKKMITKIFR